MVHRSRDSIKPPLNATADLTAEIGDLMHPQLVIVTSGIASIRDNGVSGKSVSIDFSRHQRNSISRHVLWGTNHTVYARGAFLSYSTGSVRLIEVLDLEEFGRRFEHLMTVKLMAKGFCSLTMDQNGSPSCDQGTCDGSCTLNNIPAYCSCDD